MTRIRSSQGWLNFLHQPGTIRLWMLSSLPLWTVLVFTGYADPAAGYDMHSGAFIYYLPVAVLIVAASIALNWVKGFLVLYLGKVNCGLIESGRRLARIHGLMVLLEALATLCLFLIRKASVFPLLEQVQLFGHELVYAVLLGSYLYMRSETRLRRAVMLGLGCFLLSSGWLLLSVIAAL